jgi:DNA-directed RNA polymerase specialized sigma24 family protein
VNRPLDLLRERGRRAEVATEGEQAAAERLDHRLGDDLAGALAALDGDTRAIVVLRHLLDYSSNESEGRLIDRVRTLVGRPAPQASLGALDEVERRRGRRLDRSGAMT